MSDQEMSDIKRRVGRLEKREERDREEISALSRAVTEISSGMSALKEFIPEFRDHMRQQREMSNRQDERLKGLSDDMQETKDQVGAHGKRLDKVDNQISEWSLPLKILIAVITAASVGALSLQAAEQSGYLPDKSDQEKTQQIESQPTQKE